MAADIDTVDVRDLLESHQDGEPILDRRLPGGSYDVVARSPRRPNE